MKALIPVIIVAFAELAFVGLASVRFAQAQSAADRARALGGALQSQTETAIGKQTSTSKVPHYAGGKPAPSPAGRDQSRPQGHTGMVKQRHWANGARCVFLWAEPHTIGSRGLAAECKRRHFPECGRCCLSALPHRNDGREWRGGRDSKMFCRPSGQGAENLHA